MKTRTKWGVGAIAAVILIPILLATAGVWIYINWIKDDPPAAFSLDDAPAATDPTATDPTTAPSTTAATDGTDATATTVGSTTTAGGAGDGSGAADGTWSIGDGSQVGYRVTEVLFGQDTEGVGRTEDIEGSIEISGAQVTAGSFTVQMATIESDEGRRDSQFRGRLMDTDQFPTSTFALTAPIELGSVPAEGQQVTATATGDLTLRGTTKPVTFDVQAVLEGGQIRIVGSTDIVFADYGIPQPDTGGITTQNHGLLEFSLVLAQGA